MITVSETRQPWVSPMITVSESRQTWVSPMITVSESRQTWVSPMIIVSETRQEMEVNTVFRNNSTNILDLKREMLSFFFTF